MKRSLLLSAGFLSLVFPAFAIIDENNNGLSDLWEKANNDDQLFPTTFDPQADDDQDGWTNEQEAAAGTDPADPNPPDGLVRPDVEHTPMVFGPPDENGIPTVATPESVTLTWPTIPGKQYTLLISTDLAPESWLPSSAIPPFIGNGNQVTYGFPTAAYGARFWRVKVEDADSDGDGLTDAEEYTLGTNPALLDSDSDSLPDAWELGYGLDPNDDGSVNVDNGASGDLDEDGVPNADEQTGGTDPTNANDFPIQMLEIRKWAEGNSDGVDWGEYPYIGYYEYGIWDDNIAVADVREEAVTPLYLKSLITATTGTPELAFPAMPPEDDETANITRTNISSGPIHHVAVHHRTADGDKDSGHVHLSRVWIKAPVLPSERKFVFIKKASKTFLPDDSTTGSSEDISAEAVEFTIPANETVSNAVDLEVVPQAEAGGRVTWNVDLLPTEIRGFVTRLEANDVGSVKGKYVKEVERIMIPDSGDPTGHRTEARKELKISQWDNVFKDGGGQWAWKFEYDEFIKNNDVFRIRLPKGTPPARVGKHEFKVWTEDATGNIVDEGARVVLELDPVQGFFQTEALCLVANMTEESPPDEATDDEYEVVEGKADGAINDRTYRAELGGTVKFKWLTPPGPVGTAQPVISIPVPVKKIVTAKGFILQEGSSAPSDEEKQNQINSVTDYFEHARNALSTCGVKLNYSASSISPNPGGVEFEDGPFLNPKFDVEHGTAIMTQESKALIDGVKADTGVIPVYFVNNFQDGGAGVTTVESAMLQADIGYSNAVILNKEGLARSTLTHELIHVLINTVHDGPDALWAYYNTTPSWCIWYTNKNFAQPENGIFARKRIVETMRTKILKSKFCKDPPP